MGDILGQVHHLAT